MKCGLDYTLKNGSNPLILDFLVLPFASGKVEER